jgi:hypothetical protein
MTNNKFTITKKITKHGRQAVIIVPTLLQNRLPARTLGKITIEILETSTR